MKELSIQPVPWGKVALAVVPGLWLTLQQRTDSDVNVLAMFGTAAITLAIGSALLLLSRNVEHRVALWCLPLFGALSWKGMEFEQQLYMAGRMGLISPLWYRSAWSLAIVAGAILGFTLFPYWIFKCFRNSMPKVGRAIAGLLVLLAIGTGLTLSLPYSMVLPMLYFAVLGLLVPVVVGSFLTERSPLTTTLFVVAFEPFWIDVYLKPRGPITYHLFQTTTNPSLSYEALNLALIVITYLPFLSFLVLIPMGLLRSRTQMRRLAWLLLPSLLTLVVITLALGWALRGTSSEYSLAQWGQAVLAAALLWLPLALSAVIANSVHPSHAVATSDAMA